MAKRRKHGFVGIISHVKGDAGFIRPEDVRRMDGREIGLTIERDVFVHINAFDQMTDRYRFPRPDHLEVGMEIAFTIGASTNRPGNVTAEFCTLYRSARENEEYL